MTAAAAADPTVATGILGVEIAEGGGSGGGATTWIPATDGGTGLESVLVLCRMGALGTTPTPGETWGTTGRWPPVAATAPDGGRWWKPC